VLSAIEKHTTAAVRYVAARLRRVSRRLARTEANVSPNVRRCGIWRCAISTMRAASIAFDVEAFMREAPGAAAPETLERSRALKPWRHAHRRRE